MSSPRISAVIKARNEEGNLEACIRSLDGFADEVVLVDDKSVDSTAELGRKLGAQVFAGVDHGGVINRLDVQGFGLASGDYILRLDADERLTPGLASSLKAAARSGQYAGVRYARRYWFFDGWLDHGGWFRSEQLGFFRSDSWDRNWNCDIHAQVPVVGPVLTLPADVDACMLHLDYFAVSEFVDRSLAKYARSEAAERVREGYVFSAKSMVRLAARRSIGRYLRHRGYRDGARGAVVAGLLGAYEVAVAAYAWELTRDRTAN